MRKASCISRLGLTCCVLTLVVIISACGGAASSPSSRQGGPGSTAGSSVNASQSQGLGMSARNCPAAGTGRAATLPPLQQSNHQTIVYLSYTNDWNVLKRYDVQAHATTTILNAPDESILSAQISSNGQWIMLVVRNSSLGWAIQLIRMDGQELQTLYCAPSGQEIISHDWDSTQWSPDDRQVLFAQGPDEQHPANLYLLNLATGNVQVELNATSSSSIFQARTWMDTTHVYLAGLVAQASGFTKQGLYILDTSKGASQRPANLQKVFGASDTLWDFDSTYGASKLFVLHYQLPTYGPQVPGSGQAPDPASSGPFSQLDALPITGGNGTMIFHSSSMIFSELRVVGYGSSSLLLGSNERGSPDDQYNGLWKVNTDGSDLVRLTNLPGWFNPFSQYPWANVSRDNSLYLDFNSFGSLNGGPLTQYTSDPSTEAVGWTIM
jgi:hypothetical protein